MKLAIVGAGGHARVVADAALATEQWSEIVFFDDNFPDLTVSGRWEVKGSYEALKLNLASFDGVIVGIGNCDVRKRLHGELEQLNAKLISVIHPKAVIGVDCLIGSGVAILANAVVNTGTSVGDAVIINTAATVDHDCTLGAAAHICPGVNLAGQVAVGGRSWVGVGASVKQQITIGSDVMIGAGAAVVTDIADGKIAVGVPAKII